MKLRHSVPLLLFVVWANVPLWLASYYFGLTSKGVFDVEFLLLGVCALFLPPWVTALLFLSGVTLDLFSAVSVTYLFSASEAWHSLCWMPNLVPQHRGGLVAVVIAILIGVGLARFVRMPASPARRYSSRILLLMAVLCVATDLTAGKAASWGAERQFGTPRLSRTPLRSLWVINGQFLKQVDAASAVPHPFAVSSASQTNLLPASFSGPMNARPNVVLVLVESWGQATRPDLARALLQPYDDPALDGRYTLQSGTVAFHGPTIDGEARELCGIEQGFSLLHATSAELTRCLPATMASLGYRTIGVHGYMERMYGRNDWWKAIGFQDLWFREQLERRHLATCPGAFSGICDAAIAQWIGDGFEEPSASPAFLYWVTLNSHLPVAIPNHVERPASCSALKATSQSLALCSWYQLVVNTQRSVATLAMRPSNRPCIFLIVGDHQPPFSTPALREQFSDKVVPYILLLPRDVALPGQDPPPIALLAQHHPPTLQRKTRARAARTNHAGG